MVKTGAIQGGVRGVAVAENGRIERKDAPLSRSAEVQDGVGFSGPSGYAQILKDEVVPLLLRSPDQKAELSSSPKAFESFLTETVDANQKSGYFAKTPPGEGTTEATLYRARMSAFVAEGEKLALELFAGQPGGAGQALFALNQRAGRLYESTLGRGAFGSTCHWPTPVMDDLRVPFAVREFPAASESAFHWRPASGKAPAPFGGDQGDSVWQFPRLDRDRDGAPVLPDRRSNQKILVLDLCAGLDTFWSYGDSLKEVSEPASSYFRRGKKVDGGDL